jgi:hypothetical protein
MVDVQKNEQIVVYNMVVRGRTLEPEVILETTIKTLYNKSCCKSSVLIRHTEGDDSNCD